MALPALIFVGIFLYQERISFAPAILLITCLLLYLLLVAAALIEGLVRPLQTLSNVVASLREGDYSFRACGAGSEDALGELATEINALADLLQKQRVRSLEATALLARILEVMHTPLFAFDRHDRLQLASNSGAQLLGRPLARCYNQSARELGLQELLAAPDQTTHSFGAKPTRWLLRKAAFRQDGAPHTLLLLADVSLPLQEEEQMAWKRLIRVLGHELSNSLAPIKSIAGSLLARVDPAAAATKRRCATSAAAWALWRAAPTRCTALCSPTASSPSCPRRNSGRFRSGRCWSASCIWNSAWLSSLNRDLRSCSTPIPISWSRCSSTCWPMPWTPRWPMARSSVRVSWRLADSAALVSIEDSGLGIANAENLFVPFYTTKPAGSGVGLALAQQIARAHGGEISLLNREDGPGARATVRLPAAGAE